MANAGEMRVIAPLKIADLPEEDRKRAQSRPLRPKEMKQLAERGLPSPMGAILSMAFPVVSSGALLGAIGFFAVELFGWLTGLWSMRHSANTLSFALGFGVAGIAVVWFEILRTRAPKAQRQSRRNDLDAGTADEVILEVADAKGCRDPEHGVLAYFLLLRGGRIFVNLATGEMPSDEKWHEHLENIPASELPGRMLSLLFGSVSGELLHTFFSGEKFQPSAIFVLRDNPESWPEFDEFCAVTWDMIEAKFSEQKVTRT